MHLSIKVLLVAAVMTAIMVVSQIAAAAKKTEKVSEITSAFPPTLVLVAVVGLHAAVIPGSVIGAAVAVAIIRRAVAIIRRAVAAVITVPDDVHVPLVSFSTTLSTGVRVDRVDWGVDVGVIVSFCEGLESYNYI